MKTLFISLISSLIFLSTNAQTTITLQPGPTDGKDISLLMRTPNDTFDPNSDPYESNTLYTWTHSGQLSLKRVFIGFDFSQIPANATIQDAKLSLYYNPTDAAEGFDYHTGSNDAFIERVIAPWSLTSITWNNQANTTTTNRVSLPASANQTQNYTDVDVTQLIQDMVNDPNGAHGFRIRMQDETTPYRSLLFASSRHPNTSLRPKLVVTYTTSSSTCFTLQPGTADGKDISLLMRTPNDTFDPNSDPYESNTLYTWTHSGQLSLKRVFIDFNFSQIPANATIQNAKLSLYYNPTDAAEGFDYHTGSNDAFIERVIAPWSLTSITWNNQANTTTTNRVSLPASANQTQNYTDIDVTQLVQDMVNDPNGAHGFRIRMQDETTPYRSLLFASSRHPDTSLRPTLNVCYSSISSSTNNINTKENSVAVYPNPSEGIFNIEILSNENNPLTTQVYNSIGQLVLSKTINEGNNDKKNMVIDLSSYAKGTYQVLIRGENYMSFHKIISF